MFQNVKTQTNLITAHSVSIRERERVQCKTCHRGSFPPSQEWRSFEVSCVLDTVQVAQDHQVLRMLAIDVELSEVLHKIPQRASESTKKPRSSSCRGSFFWKPDRLRPADSVASPKTTLFATSILAYLI